MARRKVHDEHLNHEAWSIPYGDLVTLLLAFFVVMYAVSSVNEGKYRLVSDSLNAAFRGTPHSPDPIAMGDAHADAAAQMPLSQLHSIFGAVVPAAKATPPPAANADPLARVAADVSAAMAPLIRSSQLSVHRYASWVAVDISADVLFTSGAAQLSPAAVKALQRLADTLKPWPNAVRVEGYTDDRPISTAAFPSNWELSGARAATVVHLFMDRGIAPARLAVMGFGQYRPTADNATPAGRNTNRRVVVVILGTDSPPEARS
jgi:chemotaxis protein MotB